MIAAANLSPSAPASSAADSGAWPSKTSAGFDAKAAAAADARLHELRDAVTKLKSLGEAAKSTGADLARQKLEVLKQRLKMLMMMGGDPKAVAREAAQIAKEIGEAAKAYAAAAGGTSAAAATAEPAAAPAERATGTESGASGPDAKAQAEPASPDALQAGAPEPGAGKPGGPNQDANEKPATDDGRAGFGKPGKPEALGGPTGPDPFITEAKQLTARAKAILQAAIARARREHADPQALKEDQATVQTAEKDVEDAARTMNATEPAQPYSATGEASPAPAAAPPSVDLSA